MLLDYNSINNLFNEYNVDHKYRTELLTIIVAQHIAQCLPLPTSPVNSINIYYLESVSPLADKMINDFNEGIIIQVNSAMRLVQYIYCLRYNLVYNVTEVNCVDFLKALFKSSTDIPNNSRECFANADENLIDSLNYRVSKIFINKKEASQQC